MRESSSITSGVMTFIERPGMSQVASAMPSASTSKRKFVKSHDRSPSLAQTRSMIVAVPMPAATQSVTSAVRLAGPLEFVEHGAENHAAGRAERMAHRDRAAVDVDLGGIEVEGLHVAQDDRRERLVDLEEVDVVLRHAGLPAERVRSRRPAP